MRAVSIRKRIAAFGAAAVMLISAAPAAAFAEDGGNVLEGYRLTTELGTVCYSDSFFDEPGTELNEHLRTLSLTLAASVSDGADGKSGACEILKNTGFETGDIYMEGLEDNSDPLGIGSLMCHKNIGGRELVAVAIRSTEYGAEWASNFTVGTESDAKGFKDSAEAVIKRLLGYEEKHGLKGAAIWISGYSRGGGVSDQIGKYINENLSQFGIGEGDLYVYTFAAPRTSLTKTEYRNIHDFVDVNDAVPFVLPESWGFYRTGTETSADCGDNRLTAKIVSLFGDDHIEDMTEYVKDPETGEYREAAVEYPTPEYLRSLLTAMTDKISRENIAELSPYLQKLLPLFFGTTKDPRMMDFVNETINNTKVKLTSPLIVWLFSVIYDEAGSEDYDRAFRKLPGVLEEIIEDAGTKDMVSEEHRGIFIECVTKVLYYLLPVVRTDFSNGMPLVATLAGNVSSFREHHIPEHYFSLLTEADSYFTEGVTVRSGSVRYPDENRVVSDPDKIAELGLSEAELQKLRDGYDIIVTAECAPRSISGSEEAAVREAVGGFGEVRSIMAFDPKYYIQLGFEDAQPCQSGEAKELMICLDQDTASFSADTNETELVRVTDGKVTVIKSGLKAIPADGGRYYIREEVCCGLGANDYYAAVAVEPAARTESGESSEVSESADSADKPESKAHAESSGTAEDSGSSTPYIIIAACGAAGLAVIIAVTVIISKKKKVEKPSGDS